MSAPAGTDKDGLSGEFSGRTVMVTGASAGAGRAIARAFARQGARLGLLARGKDGLEATAREVRELGGEAVVVPADVSDPDQVEAAAAEVERRLGPLSVWVNNAMVSAFGPYLKMDPADYKRVTEVTYLGQVYGTGAALRRMLPRNAGSIVLVGSALAYRGIPLQSAYCGAKHAVHGFFESLRAELERVGSEVHLGMVQLPAMNTPQFDWVKNYMNRRPRPMGTVYEPEVGAEAVLEMVRTGAREIFVGFSTLEAVWGNKAAPGLMDSYLARTAYEGQLTDEPDDPGRPSNLWQPVEGDFGARGRFSDVAKKYSMTGWLRTHKTFGRVMGALGLALVASLFLED